METNVVVDKFIILHATSKKEAGIILPSPFGNHGLEPYFVIKKIGLGLSLILILYLIGLSTDFFALIPFDCSIVALFF